MTPAPGGATTLSATAWPTGGAQPGAQITASDAAPSLAGPGVVGVRLSAANHPGAATLAILDDLVVGAQTR